MTKKITDISGVYAHGIHCGIKSDTQNKDLSFVYVPGAKASAGVFSKNRFRAPSLDYTARCNKEHQLKAVIVNSGNANAGTGEQGMANVEAITSRAASLLDLAPSEVANASTGIIGVQLPMETLEKGISTLLKDPHARNATAAAEGILTLDTCIKETFVSATIDGQEISIGGFAKGAGMIAPNMGTMLGFLVTDALIDGPALQTMLQRAVEDSFNMVSVDTDTSTNDCVLMFATGEHQISLDNKESSDAFLSLLKEACCNLAKMIAADGEGATKFIEVTVSEGTTTEECKAIALSVVSSPLLKCAVHGADPNWGRVLMAAGKVQDSSLDTNSIEIRFFDTAVYKDGGPASFNREQLIKQLQADEIAISIFLGQGTASAQAWGCDLTKGYIDINTAYN